MWPCNKFLCSIIRKGAQPFDFIKGNAIRKLAYKVKYISQSNGGWMFLGNSRIRSFLNLLAQLWIIWWESMQEKETKSTEFSVRSVKRR